MADKLTYVTAEGLEKLKVELNILKSQTRRELANRIEAAKALGDLSENAEYHEAKEALSFVQGRIYEIDDMLKNVSVIPGGESGGAARIGSTVEVDVLGKKKTYKIVGSNEADPVAGLISNESPIGEAFLGRMAGESVEVKTPAGGTVYKILKVS